MTPLGYDRLGPQAATLFLNFVSLPAETLHSDWHPVLIPDWVAESSLSQDPAALSKSLIASLELTDDLSMLDFQNPVHQAALMPPEGLMGLTRHLGLGLHASEFLRVIERDKITALDQALSADDWQVLQGLSRHDWPREPLSVQDLSSIAMQFPEDGLACLTEIFSQEIRDIGQRALLKLPRSQRESDPALVARGVDLFPGVYESFVVHWQAAWRDLWLTSVQDTVH